MDVEVVILHEGYMSQELNEAINHLLGLGFDVEDIQDSLRNAADELQAVDNIITH